MACGAAGSTGTRFPFRGRRGFCEGLQSALTLAHKGQVAPRSYKPTRICCRKLINVHVNHCTGIFLHILKVDR